MAMVGCSNFAFVEVILTQVSRASADNGRGYLLLTKKIVVVNMPQYRNNNYLCPIINNQLKIWAIKKMLGFVSLSYEMLKG